MEPRFPPCLLTSISLLEASTSRKPLRIRRKKSICWLPENISQAMLILTVFPKDSPAKELGTVNSKMLFRENCDEQVCACTSLFLWGY